MCLGCTDSYSHHLFSHSMDHLDDYRTCLYIRFIFQIKFFEVNHVSSHQMYFPHYLHLKPSHKNNRMTIRRTPIDVHVHTARITLMPCIIILLNDKIILNGIRAQRTVRTCSSIGVRLMVTEIIVGRFDFPGLSRVIDSWVW